MRVNVYAEEMTDRVEIVSKTNREGTFTGVRFHLALPVTVHTPDGPQQIRGPFQHSHHDDDSSAVTFWGKGKLKDLLIRALSALDIHEQMKAARQSSGSDMKANSE